MLKLFIPEFKDNWSNNLFCYKPLKLENTFSYIDGNIENMTTINIKEVSDRSILEDEQSWRSDLQNKPKLRSYMKFKNNINVENHVTYCKSKHTRSLIAQFRVGTYPLQIEVGRYCHIPLENRLCTLCCLNKIDGEFHIVCTCPKYSEVQNFLIQSNALTHPLVTKILNGNSWT